MQHPGVNVTEHAVAQTVTIKQRAELRDVISKMFRRHTGVLGKGNRFCRPFRITQQAYRFFTHGIDTLNARQFSA